MKKTIPFHPHSALLAVASAAIALAAPMANAVTTTFNTAGTTNWTCPAGVTSIQVECWGGGGAGGLGTHQSAGSNTSQNGGGGGGGAYARRVSVPVTPGLTYAMTIPAQAVSGTNGNANGGGIVSGGNVTFVGDGAVTVTAAGGTGGKCANSGTSNATTGQGGGAGGTTAASLGDTGATFAGGAGSTGNTGSTSVPGSGGGGAGDANPGGAAVTASPTTTPGAGGIAGGGAGGAGHGSGNGTSYIGSDGATPGGGGGGAKNCGNSTTLGGKGGMGQIKISYTAPAVLSWNTGDGTWDTSTPNWVDASLAASAYADPSTVTFDDASGASGNPTITLNSTFSPAAVTMKSTSHNYTVSGTGAIAGITGLTLDAANSQTLTLSTLNTFSGNVTVNAGTLVANATETSGAAPLGAATNTRTITVGSGATLQLAQGKALKALFSSSNVPSLIINGTVSDTNLSNPGNNPLGNVTLNNGTLTASVGNSSGYGSYNFNGTVTSTGTSLISSTASVPITLSAATGNITTFDVQSGTLTVSAALGQITASGDAQVSGLTKLSAGTLTLTGANTYTGPTTVTAGTLNASATDVLGTGAPLLVNGGMLALSSFSSTVGAVTLASGSITGAGGTLTGTSFAVQSGSASAILGGTGATLTKTTGGTVTLTAANTYTGSTLVSGGTLTLSGSGAVNSSSDISVNGSGAKLVQASSAAVAPTITLTNGTVTGSGTVSTVNVTDAAGNIVSNNDGVAGAALMIGTLTFNGAATVNTFGNASAPIVTTSLASNAAGTVTINPTAASWTAGTTYDLISYGGGTINGAGFSQFTLGTVTGLTLHQTATLGHSGTAITLTIGGLDGSPYWVGDGDGKWNLTSTNNWKMIPSGSYATFYATDIVLFDDNASGTGPISVNIDTANVATTSTTFNNSTKDYTLTGAHGISAGSLTKHGTATVTIGTTNTYTGGTSITAGTLKLNGAGTLGAAGASVAVSSGGLLDLNGTSQSIAFTAGTGVGTVANNSGSGTSTLTLAGTPTINGSLVTIQDYTTTPGGKIAAVITATTQSMSNANTYSGGTTVDAGAYLYLDSTSPLGAGTGTIHLPATNSGLVVDGVTYANDITGAGYVHNNSTGASTTVFTGNLNTSGPFLFRAGTGIVYNFAGNGTTSTLSGVIGSTTSMVNGAVTTGSIIKSGTGTLTLTGTNTYTGATTVSGGTLTLAGSSSGTLGSVTVAGSGTPQMNIQAGSYTLGSGGFYVGTTGSPGIVNQTGGALTWNNAGLELLIGNGGAGTYNLSGGSVTTIASTTRGIMLGVNAGGTATFNLSGTGALTTTGSLLMIGRSDASSANTTNLFSQTGGTATIATLAMGGPNAAAGDNCSATLTLTGGTFSAAAFTLLSAAAGDTSTINIGGTAVVTLPAFPIARGTGSTATINFDGGTLKPAAASTTFMGGLTNAFIKAGGARFDTTNGSITITQNLLTHATSTGGGLIKDGANTLTLAGTNTYSGNTTVNAGTLTLGNANPGNDASTVTIAASGATLNLTYAGTDTVGQLFIGTTQMAAGVYGVGNIVIPQITGTGTLTVVNGPGFATWITGTFANGTVPSGKQGPNDNPTGDGICNLLKYAIAGQDPTVANPTISTFSGDTLSFTKRAATNGLTYAIVQSSDLGVTDPWTEVPAGPSYINNSTTISYTLTPGSPVKDFIRLSVIEAP